MLKFIQDAPVSQDNNSYLRTQVLAQLYGFYAAMAELERASDNGNYSVVNLGIDRSLWVLHGNVRFVALTKKLRLADDFCPINAVMAENPIHFSLNILLSKYDLQG